MCSENFLSGIGNFRRDGGEHRDITAAASAIFASANANSWPNGDRIHKKTTADEELQGRSIWDIVDRGTLMVGCCLIVIVIITIAIPVALISEDVPYVAPAKPPKPTSSPTRACSLNEEAIGECLAKITAGGLETLLDPQTAHHRA